MRKFVWMVVWERDRDPDDGDALPRWLKILSFSLAVIGVAGIIVWRTLFS